MKENQYFASRYKEIDVNTATPLQLIVMLYDAAICSLEEARGRTERKDIAGRNLAVNKCNAIISELQASLNLEEGGEIAFSLNRLYDYMKRTLFRAGIEQNPELLVEVSKLLENLRSAWRQTASINAASAQEVRAMEFVPQNTGFQGIPAAAENEYMKSFSISA